MSLSLLQKFSCLYIAVKKQKEESVQQKRKKVGANLGWHYFKEIHFDATEDAEEDDGNLVSTKYVLKTWQKSTAASSLKNRLTEQELFCSKYTKNLSAKISNKIRKQI